VLPKSKNRSSTSTRGRKSDRFLPICLKLWAPSPLAA